ncbi:MAG: hypothetical protein U1A16_04680 [Patescibacteria group bacterium]|nr:hypothetical protein [Patescibacteria group bacterium]
MRAREGWGKHYTKSNDPFTPQKIVRSLQRRAVKKFADRMSKSFMDSAKRERQRSDEEKQLRKIEFEG